MFTIMMGPNGTRELNPEKLTMFGDGVLFILLLPENLDEG